MKGPGSSSLHDARVSAALHRVCRAHTPTHAPRDLHGSGIAANPGVCAKY